MSLLGVGVGFKSKQKQRTGWTSQMPSRLLAQAIEASLHIDKRVFESIYLMALAIQDVRPDSATQDLHIARIDHEMSGFENHHSA
ncbi:MAG: hypothetical protein CL912_14485 [Deltaproteobacteria bacterium]|nr:hypothetical protein [Deltaproteobacteria bacterium]